MDLSILIPARNEMFLARTIQDILEHAEGDTEVIAVCDGAWPDPPIQDHPRVHLIYHSQSIGQRAATNEAAKMSTAKFVMKCDAHCAFEQGFDVKLMADCEKDWTVIPRMYNLHVFDWKCKQCGNQTYMGPYPTKCEKCDNTKDFEREMIWKPRLGRKTDFARFDNNLHFQYWGAYGKRPEAQGDIADVMCSVGACWFMHRERFWEIEGVDERHGSWGQMGVEIACKSWLSGGRQVVNKKTWFAHMFRTQPGFGFPYPNPGIDKAREYSHWLWEGGNWPKAIHPLSWLILKFAPVPDWAEQESKWLSETSKAGLSGSKMEPSPPTAIPSATPAEKTCRSAGTQFAVSAAAPSVTSIPISIGREAAGTARKMRKSLVFYSDNRLERSLAEAVQGNLRRCCNGYEIISVTLQPMDFGRNIVLEGPRGVLSMFKQILAGLEASESEVIFLAEHDILYHPSHFAFVPPRKDVFYYNTNVWKLRLEDGLAVRVDFCQQTSGLCAYRELMLEHYRKRVERVERDGYDRHIGFEPGTHSFPRGIDNYKAESWESEFPIVDIRHAGTLTPSRWSPDLFRNPKYAKGWQEAHDIPGWGPTESIIESVLGAGREGRFAWDALRPSSLAKT